MPLAQSDFVIRTCHGGSASTYDDWLGGGDGSAIIHSDLSSPLVGEGLYARSFTNATPTGLDYAGSYFGVASTIDSGLWVNNFINYAYSIRAWVRIETEYDYTVGNNTTNEMNIGVFAGYPSLASGLLTTSETGPRFALYLRQEPDTSTSSTGAQVKLCFADRTFGPLDLNSPDVTVLNNLATKTWYRIRLDVIPTPDYFTVRIYTGTGTTGSETWTLQYNSNIAPGTATSPITSPSLGFFAAQRVSTSSGAADTISGLIDRVTFLGEDLTS